MINLKINGQNVEVKEGTTVLQAAAEIGVIIPTLCYHKDLSSFGGCRLCVVHVQGARLPMTSCNLPVSPGLVVETDTPEVIRYRRAVLRMILSRYYDAAYKPSDGKADLEQESELVHWARVYDVDVRSNMSKKPFYPVDSDPNPFVWVDMNKCIQCTRCVRACAEIQGRFVWSQSFRGYRSRIVAGADSTMLASRCESCGACVVYCPTGALDNKMSIHAGPADRLIRSVCSYCGVGCVFDLNVRDDKPGGRVIRVTSNTDRNSATVNSLHLCVKGRYGYDFIHHPGRHTQPRVRKYLLDGSERPIDKGSWVDVDWDTALRIVAQKFHQTHNHFGASSIGLLASGRCLNEENYLAGKFARQVIGTNHIDCSSNLYYANITNGLLESLGLPAMSNSFDDIASQSKALLVIGSNLTEQHPVFGTQIRQAILRRKVKMVVASPDFYNIDEYAALALYHHPNTETTLVNGIMHIILEKGWQNNLNIQKYPHGYDQFKEMIDRYTPSLVSEITGVSEVSLTKAAEILANNQPMSIIWSTGLANHQTGKTAVQALVNLQLLLGNLDKPGGGVNPLRSQSNTQGACDMGCTPQFLPGYRLLVDQKNRQEMEIAWGADIHPDPGLDAQHILKAALQGQVKALYVFGEDILNTSPQAIQVRKALENLDFLVLQEIATSDTTRYADVILPGASFAEKSGTVTSTERRLQLVRQAILPPGQARADWEIIRDLANVYLELGNSAIKKSMYSDWNYHNTGEIMQEISAVVPIYSGISHSLLENNPRLQWPLDDGQLPGTSILKIGTFSDGQIRWLPAEQMSLVALDQ